MPHPEERIKLIKAMEFLARQINNEDIFMGWLMNGVADGDIPYGDLSVKDTDKDDLSIYIEDDRSFADLMGCFMRVMSRARKDGGIWCDRVLSSE